MNYYILCYIAWAVGIYADNCILLSSFDLKNPKANRLLSAAVLTGYMLPFFTAKYLFNQSSPLLRNLSLLCILVTSVVYMHCKMEGKLWQKILFVILQEVAFFCAEILVIIVLSDSIALRGVDYNDSFGFLLCVLINFAGFMLYLLVLLIWRRLVMKRSFNSSGFLLFALFPASQILLTYAHSQLVFQRIDLNISYITIGTLIGFIADGILISMLLRQQHLEEMRQRIADMQKAWETEQKHYQEIETRREQLAKIRHDLREQFVVMKELNRQKEYEQVSVMLDTLTDYVANTKETVYCADSVVNAILSENERMCEANQIRLEYSLDIPEPLKLNPVVTCNLFSNLFRNAIRAVCMLSESDPPPENFSQDESRCIRLNARLCGNFLHVRMQNPYAPKTEAASSKKISGRKHYGLEILGDIAKLQNGKLDISQKDGLYIVSISVENTEVNL